MGNGTPRGNDVTVHRLLGVIRDAIEASAEFTEENAAGNYQCMTLWVQAKDGPELTVSVTNPEVMD